MKCGQIGVAIVNCRESVMRQGHLEMVILGVGCIKHGFGGREFDPSSCPEMIS